MVLFGWPRFSTIVPEVILSLFWPIDAAVYASNNSVFNYGVLLGFGDDYAHGCPCHFDSLNPFTPGRAIWPNSIH